MRYKNMTGFQSPYVPGWDTHGLPTELKARKQAGVGTGSDISDLELRKICREIRAELCGHSAEPSLSAWA